MNTLFDCSELSKELKEANSRYKAQVSFSLTNRIDVEVEAKDRESAFVKIKSVDEYKTNSWLITSWKLPKN